MSDACGGLCAPAHEKVSMQPIYKCATHLQYSFLVSSGVHCGLKDEVYTPTSLKALLQHWYAHYE